MEKGCETGDEGVWSRYLRMDPCGIRCERLVSLVNVPWGASPMGGAWSHQAIGTMAVPVDPGQPLPSVCPLMAGWVHERSSRGGRDGNYA